VPAFVLGVVLCKGVPRRASIEGRLQLSENIHGGGVHFLKAAREQDDEFTILPLAGIGNNLCIGADVPNYKSGIEHYF
jgi:hypothetical protein